MDEKRDYCMIQEKGKAKKMYLFVRKQRNKKFSITHIEKLSFAFILTRDSLLNEIIIIILIIKY